MNNQNNNQPNKKDALKDYVEVNVRIEKFWAENPEGRIDTEIISLADGMAVMKASVYKNINDAKPSAVGHAYEKEGNGFINKTSYIENCETSAVGRALAIMGYEIKKSIASYEEVANAQYQQNQSKTASEGQATTYQQAPKVNAFPNTFKPASDKAKGLMFKLIRDYGNAQGKDVEALKMALAEKYSLSSLDDVSASICDAIIKGMQAGN